MSATTLNTSRGIAAPYSDARMIDNQRINNNLAFQNAQANAIRAASVTNFQRAQNAEKIMEETVVDPPNPSTLRGCTLTGRAHTPWGNIWAR
jgi:hypothetical protein